MLIASAVMVRWLIFVVVWVIAGCDNVLERYHQNPLQPAAPQPAEQARVSLSLLQPAITPSSSWKINVTAGLYHPVDMSNPAPPSPARLIPIAANPPLWCGHPVLIFRPAPALPFVPWRNS